ncbi:MAG: glycoside hydrolase family 18 protein [Chitinophagaceae bacterium]
MPKLSAQQLLFLCLIAVSLYSCSKKDISVPQPPPIIITPPPDFGFKVVGYFPYYRDPASVPDEKFRMCNVVNYAFATVNSAAGLTLNDPAKLSIVTARAKLNNAKIFLSINGAAADFKSMAASAEGRNQFIRAILSIVRQYGLHGVDMDWEFPSTADGTDLTFTALMRELSDSCHRDARYYLTAAITPGKYAGSFRDAIRGELFSFVDWFNVMCYDDFSTTVRYRHHSDMSLALTGMNYWISTRGMPASKFVLGMPAYGRPSGITQSGTVLSYNTILSRGGSPLSDSAIVSVSGFPSTYTIYYNGQPLIKKKSILAKQRGNGIMIWEHGHDSQDATSLFKAACDTIGREY